MVNTSNPVSEDHPVPNVEYETGQVTLPDNTMEWTVFVKALRKIEPGEELLADYHYQLALEEMQTRGKANVCKCEDCKSKV